MKKGKIVSLIIAFTIVSQIYFSNSKVFALEDMVESVKNYGINIEDITIDSSSEIKTTDLPQNIALNIYTSSGLNLSYKINAAATHAELYFKDKEVNGYIKVKNIINRKDKYVFFLLSHNYNNRNINNYTRRNILKGYHYYNVNPSFSSLIRGKIMHKLSNGQMTQVGSDIMKNFNCTDVNGITDNKIISYTGYNKFLQDKVLCDDKYVNINLGMRYNSIDKCTNVLIASPVIPVEY